MPSEYLKKPCIGTSWGPSGAHRKGDALCGEEDVNVVNTVSGMLEEIREGREECCLKYSQDLDKYAGPCLLTADLIQQKCALVPEQTKLDIQFSVNQVRKFAEAQRKSLSSFEVDIGEGITAGQKVTPLETAGCYAPGGRYSHIASAVMSVTTARVAGVKN